MAKQPSYIDKVNTIVKFVDNPCDAPWTVYFETAIASAGRQIFVLLTFGLDDIVRGYFRPKGVYQARRSPFGRRGKSKHRPGVIIPEIGEMIGKRLPGGEEVRGRTVTQGVKTMWVIDGVIQRLLWYWLIIDVTIDFFYTWATLVQESKFCRNFGRGRALRTGTSSPMLGLLGWQGVLAPVAVYAEGQIITAIGSYTLLSGTWEVTAAANFQNPGETVQNAELGLSLLPSTPELFGSSGRVAVNGGSSSGLIANATIKGPTIVFMIGFLDTGLGHMTGIIFSAIEQPPPVPIPI